MLGYIFIFGLLLGSFYWIIHPLLQEDGRQRHYAPKPEDVLEALRAKKEGAYATIRELEFDLSMGKLTEEDFKMLKLQYLQEAAGYMKEIDELESQRETVSQPAEVIIEEESGQDIGSSSLPELPAGKYIYCTSCGQRAAVEDRFCVDCGSNLHEQRGEK